MEGNGVYNKAALCQMSLADTTEHLLAKAIDRYGKHYQSSTKNISIADLGASQGRNSMRLIEIVLENLRKSFPSNEVLVLHEDQPANDFQTLLDTINSSQSYLESYPNIFAGVISKSFYHRLVPAASIDLFVSYISVHWMSSTPTSLPGSHIFVNDPATKGVISPGIFETWRQASHNDLVIFLRHRSVELVDHGAMCLTFPSESEDKRLEVYLTGMGRTVEALVADGYLSSETMERMTGGIFLRTKQDVLNAVAAVPEVKLEEFETINMDFEFETPTDTANFWLSIFKPTFLSAMTETERNNPIVIDALKEYLTARIIDHYNSPNGPIHVRICYSYLCCTKVPRTHNKANNHHHY